jgi:hypothetical protein
MNMYALLKRADPTDDDSGYGHSGDLLGDPTFTTTVPAALDGQAIVLDGEGDYTGILKMVNSTVSYNQALGNNHNVGGNGIWQFENGIVPEIHLIDTTIVNNASNNNGGGLSIDTGSFLTSTFSTIAQNKEVNYERIA